MRGRRPRTAVWKSQAASTWPLQRQLAPGVRRSGGLRSGFECGWVAASGAKPRGHGVSVTRGREDRLPKAGPRVGGVPGGDFGPDEAIRVFAAVAFVVFGALVVVEGQGRRFVGGLDTMGSWCWGLAGPIKAEPECEPAS